MEWAPELTAECPKGHCHNYWVQGSGPGKDRGCTFKHEQTKKALAASRAASAAAAKAKGKGRTQSQPPRPQHETPCRFIAAGKQCDKGVECPFFHFIGPNGKHDPAAAAAAKPTRSKSAKRSASMKSEESCCCWSTRSRCSSSSSRCVGRCYRVQSRSERQRRSADCTSGRFAKRRSCKVVTGYSSHRLHRAEYETIGCRHRVACDARSQEGPHCWFYMLDSLEGATLVHSHCSLLNGF